MTQHYTTTLAGQNYSFATNIEAPTSPPKALILTRAVQTKAGWRGQVLIDGDIIQETAPFEDGQKALDHVTKFVVETIKRLFT